MLGHYNRIGVLSCVLCCAIYSSNVLAELTAQQIYYKMNQNNSRIPSDLFIPSWLKQADDENSQIIFTVDSALGNKELEKKLSEKVALGDPDALFYVAMLKLDEAELLQSAGEKNADATMIGQSNMHYDEAIQFFKIAGDAGINTAYWNVALCYATGRGNIRSPLAAMAFYYKAGLGYLNDGYSAMAVAALKAIRAIQSDSGIGKLLEKKLGKEAPAK